MIGSNLPTIALDDFVRRFPLRAGNLMWFLGAGASAAAGLPTALDMIWEFKKKLFVSQRHGSGETFIDLSQPAVRHRINAHIESLENLPSTGDSDEYAALFEAAYPSEMDRSTLIDAWMKGAKPSYGHCALATLMKSDLARLVWTTNFDALIADACAKIFDTTSTLTTVTLDAPDMAEQAISNSRWPIEIKLHGDFRSRRLKNTTDELRHQDAQLRRLFLSSCTQYGLIVAGYSGRDASIMDTLNDAMGHDKPFPSGLFWLHQGDLEPLPRVISLLERGLKTGVEAFLVQIENFDEVLRDMVGLNESIDQAKLKEFATERRRWTAARMPSGRRGWPVVRLNALPIIAAPTTCQLVECQIGGTAEVRKTVAKTSLDVLAVRSQAGVLAFGADADVQRIFVDHNITRRDLHSLDYQRPAELGLLRDALERALIRQCGLKLVAGHRDLVPRNPEDSLWNPLKSVVKSITGSVRGDSNLRWHEGIKIHLERTEEKLWVVFEPSTFFEGSTKDNRAICADFSRERTVKRYNRELNRLIDFWAKHLAQAEEDLRAFDISDGVDAVFRIGSTTAFSWRAIL